MCLKLHELRQGSSLETYINNLNALARNLELPEQQKIHYFIFGLKPKLKQALIIRQPQTSMMLLPICKVEDTTLQTPILILS